MASLKNLLQPDATRKIGTITTAKGAGRYLCESGGKTLAVTGSAGLISGAVIVIEQIGGKWRISDILDADDAQNIQTVEIPA